MAYPTTYATWVDLIKDWIDVDDLSDSQIQVCLDLGQTHLNKNLNSQFMEALDTITVAVSDVPIDLLAQIPDYNRVRVISSSQNGRPLLPLPYNEFQMKVSQYYWDGQVYYAAPQWPWWYAIEAMQLYIWPPAGVASELEVSYYKKVPHLATGVDSNTFTLYHPDLLIYAACAEVSKFIVEDERVPLWQASRDDGITQANAEAKDAKMGSTPLRRQVTMFQTVGTQFGWY